MKSLVIDDMRVFDERHPMLQKLELGELVYARNPYDGIRMLVGEGPWRYVFLDHDLGISNVTGEKVDIRPVVRSVCSVEDEEYRQLRLPVYYSISANPWGRKWVTDTMKQHGFDCRELDVPCRLHRFRGEL